MEDRYQDLRTVAFPMLAGVLGFDISQFKQRKGDTEWAGPCPVHKPKEHHIG